MDDEISMSIRRSPTPSFSSDEDENKLLIDTPKRKRSRSKSRGRSRSRTPKSDRKRRRRRSSRSFSRDRRDRKKDELHQRKRKHKAESESEDEELDKIMKIVKKQLKEERRKKKTSRSPKVNKQVKIIRPGVDIVKSPSADTIYKPALPKNQVPRSEWYKNANQASPNVYNEVSKFLNNIRAISEKGSRRSRSQNGSDYEDHRSPDKSTDRRTGREMADELIIQAEKQKATILPNPGKEEILDRVDPNNMNHLTSDGEFLHITCHVDNSIRARIQRGEFVELEKLLLKPKHFLGTRDGEKVEMLNKEGKTFCSLSVNAEETVKIQNVRKWEQAFRVYATIYSQANPQRSAEIFQYINVITEAARKFSWDCVAYYDFTFRHMMHKKPNRSWAKPFLELWSVSMTEPLPRGIPGNGGHHSHQSKRKDWRDMCCWKFNKTSCPYGSRCKFEHRCTYCGSYSHPLPKCLRRQGRSDPREHRDHESRNKRNKQKSPKSEDKLRD